MCTDKKKHEMDRRNFLLKTLRGVGTGIMMASPLEMFLANVATGILTRSSALAAVGDGGYIDHNYIHITCPNGLSQAQWMPMRPNGNDTFKYNSTNDPTNSMLITKLNAGGGAGGFNGEYATIQTGQNHLPHMWGGLLATPTGSAAMANLAQNTLLMRGIEMTIESHELGRYLQPVPVGNSSLLGLVGDRSTTPIPAVGVGSLAMSSDYYYSDRGIGGADGTSGPANLFAPYSGASGLTAMNSNVGAAMDNVINMISQQAYRSGTGKFALSRRDDRMNAKKLMMLQYGNLQAVFDGLKAKYQSLISRSFGDTSLFLSGLENLVIPGAQSIHYKTSVGGRVAYYTGANLNSMWSTNCNISNLANGMAVAEFMLSGGGLAPQSFSSSIHIMAGGGIDGMTVDAAFAPAVTGGGGAQSFSNAGALFTLDAHESGAYVATIAQTKYYRALSSCVYELMNGLPAASSAKTAIALSSEFNRQLRDNASGADHGANGYASTIFSKMIPENMVVGNVSVGNNGGTWGVAAPMTEFLGQNGLIGNVASTLATLLEFPTPTSNNPSYVNKGSDGKAKLNVGRPKNIA